MTTERPPLAGSGPGGERLIGGHLLLDTISEMIPVDETRVTMALNPLALPVMPDSAQAQMEMFVGLLRTGSYFILDSKQVYDALASEPPLGIPSFPPLPFKRIWIEVHSEHEKPKGHYGPSSYLRYAIPAREDSGRPAMSVDILGCGIVEVTERQLWDVYTPFRVSYADGTRSGVKLMAHRLTPHKVVAPFLREYVDGEKALKALLTMAINGAHLITARNVPHRDLPLPRAQRKRMERQHRGFPRAPKLYYVDLAASGEEEPDAPPTKREYHCRWLVMGHWRHLPNGSELCTCYEHRHDPKPATWVHPYVKGPVGAPWKGRPVHRHDPDGTILDVEAA